VTPTTYIIDRSFEEGEMINVSHELDRVLFDIMFFHRAKRVVRSVYTRAIEIGEILQI
jgi:hypothetical protein